MSAISTRSIAVILALSAASGLFSQETQPLSPQPPAAEASAQTEAQGEPEPTLKAAPRSELKNIYLTSQFGGGPMVSFGGGFGFFGNIVRPEILAGYTEQPAGGGEGDFYGFSVQFKLNARMYRLRLGERVSAYPSIGTGFTFFPNASQVVSSAFLAQELDLEHVIGQTIVTFYFEESLYFVQTAEGNLLFQLAIGLRLQPFKKESL